MLHIKSFSFLKRFLNFYGLPYFLFNFLLGFLNQYLGRTTKNILFWYALLRKFVKTVFFKERILAFLIQKIRNLIVELSRRSSIVDERKIAIVSHTLVRSWQEMSSHQLNIISLNNLPMKCYRLGFRAKCLVFPQNIEVS